MPRLELEDFLKPAPPSSSHGDFDSPQDEGLDIDAIETEAYQRGLEDGLRQAREERRQDAVEATKAAMSQAAGELERRLKAHEHARLNYVSQVFRTLLPSLAQTAFPSEAAALVEELVSELTTTGRDAPFLKLHVPPSRVEEVNAVIEDAQAAGYLACFGDPGVNEGAAEVVWPDGGATLDLPRVVDAVLNALQAALETEDSEPEDNE
ncbi:MAG: hypothetical protein AAFX08_03535 [Pseudomonadota bacterium]